MMFFIVDIFLPANKTWCDKIVDIFSCEKSASSQKIKLQEEKISS